MFSSLTKQPFTTSPAFAFCHLSQYPFFAYLLFAFSLFSIRSAKKNEPPKYFCILFAQYPVRCTFASFQLCMCFVRFISINLIECVFKMPVIMPAKLRVFNWSYDIDFAHKLNESKNTHPKKNRPTTTNNGDGICSLFTNILKRIWFLDYIFREGFRSSYLRSLPKKYQILHYLSYFRFVVSIEFVRLLNGIFDSISKCRLFALLLVFNGLQIATRCLFAVVLSYLSNILRIVTFWYENKTQR